MNGASHDSSYGRESQASSATHENSLAVKFPMSKVKLDLVLGPDLSSHSETPVKVVV